MHKAKAAYAGKITLALSHSNTADDDAFFTFLKRNFFSPTSHKKLLPRTIQSYNIIFPKKGQLILDSVHFAT